MRLNGAPQRTKFLLLPFVRCENSSINVFPFGKAAFQRRGAFELFRTFNNDRSPPSKGCHHQSSKESRDTRLAYPAQHPYGHRTSKSRYSYNKAAWESLCSIPEGLSTSAWLSAPRKQDWESAASSRMHKHICDPSGGVKGEDLPRWQRTLLNRLRAGVGCFKASISKWCLSGRAASECGNPEQSAEHIITACPLYRALLEAGLFHVGPETKPWMILGRRRMNNVECELLTDCFKSSEMLCAKFS